MDPSLSPRSPECATPTLAEHLGHIQWRVIQDALFEATCAYWNSRAAQFRAVGNERCNEIARACRNKAAFTHLTGLDDASRAAIDAILNPPETD